MIAPHPKERDRDGPSQAWLVTFADLLALMLAFFVLLFAMNSVKMDAWNAVVEALSERLNPTHKWPSPALEFDRNMARTTVARAVELDYLQRVLEQKIGAGTLPSKGLIQRLDDRIILSLPAELLFAPGQAEMLGDASETIGVIAKAMRFVGNQVNVVGHSDPNGLPEEHQFSSNWALSLGRAMTVANALRAAGYSHEIEAFGLADTRYFDISPGLDLSQRMYLSRRVDIVFRDAAARERGDEG